MEPWFIPFGWTVTVVLLSFMTGDTLGRSEIPVGTSLFYGVVFSIVLAVVRILLSGIWHLPT